MPVARRLSRAMNRRSTRAGGPAVTKRLWEMTDLVEMVEAWEESGRLAA